MSNVFKKQSFFKVVLSIMLTLSTLCSMLPLPVSAADTLGAATLTSTHKNHSFIITNTSSGDFEMKASGFKMSDGSWANCADFYADTPSDGTVYQISTLGTSYVDGKDTRKEKTVDVKTAFKLYYYAKTRRSEVNALDSSLKDDYVLTFFMKYIIRGDDRDCKYAKEDFVYELYQLLHGYAESDPDKISSKIVVENGVYYIPATSTTAYRLAMYQPKSGDSQQLLVFTSGMPFSQEGQISVTKVNKNGDKLSGAEFTVYDSTGKEVTVIGPTNSSGYAVSKLIPTGSYTVKETKYPAGYQSNGTSSWTVKVEADKITPVNGGNIVNDWRKGAIGVKKVDESGNPLEGVKFTVYSDSACTKKVTDIVTGADGIAIYGRNSSGQYTVNDKTQFWVKETATSDASYNLSSTVYPVTVVHSTITYINNGKNVVNIQKKGAIGLKKVDENGNPLENIVFGVYSNVLCTTKVSEITTDKNGYAYYGLDAANNYTLKDGTKYYLKEIRTNDDTIQISARIYSVTVAYDKITYANNGAPIVNGHKNGAVGIYKATANGKPLSGVTFGVYSDASCKTLLSEVVTDAEGSAVYGMNEDGSYTLTNDTTVWFKEIAPKDDTYVMNDTVYEVTAVSGTVTYANNGEPVVNVQKKGAVGIKKVDEESNPLSGVVFGVYSNSACTNKLAEVTTNKDGIAIYGKDGNDYTLTHGTKVWFKEISASDDSFVVDTQTYPVTVVHSTVTYANSGNPVVNYYKNGAVAIKKVDESGNALSGVTFGVYSDSACENKLAEIKTNAQGIATYGVDANGEYTVKHKTKVYFKEIAPKDATFKMDTGVYPVTVVHSTVTYANNGNPVVNYLKEGAAAIKKVDEDNKPLQGVTFGVYSDSACKNLLAEVKTDKDGIATYGLKDGQYTVKHGTKVYFKEIATSADFYELDTSVYPVTVVHSKITYANTGNPVVNYWKHGAVAIKKVDETGKPLSGVKFGIYSDAECKNLLVERVTDENGEVFYGIDANGKYYVDHGTKLYFKETATKDDTYVADNTIYTATVVHSKVTYANNESPVVNYLKNGAIAIKKVEDTGLALEGVTFGVFSDAECENKVGEMVTDANGVAVYGQNGDNFEIKHGTKLWIKEIAVPSETYVLDPTAYPVTVVHSTVTYANNGEAVVNKILRGQISLEKIGLQFTGIEECESEYGMVYEPVFTEIRLAGAVFEIRAAEDIYTADGTLRYSKDELIDTLTTTATENSVSKELYLGKYIVKEISAPAGFVLDEEAHEVIVENDGTTLVSTTQVSLTNERTKTEINAIKVAKIWNEIKNEDGTVSREIIEVPGVGFTFGLFAAEDITTVDGLGTIAKDSLISYAVTDEEGKLQFFDKLPFANYYVKELEPADEKYNVDETQYPVDLTEEVVGNAPTIVVAATESTIVNDFDKFDIDITKTDLTSGKPVPGAIIEIMDSEGNVIYNEVTGEDGKLPNIKVEPGTYTFKETIAPDGYAVNVSVFTFTVDEEGNVTGDTEIKDELTKFTIYKVDDNDKPLAGVEFTMYDAEGKIVAVVVTDAEGKAEFTGFKKGVYTIKETKTVEGFKLSDEVITVENDGAWDNKAEKASVKVVNYPIPEVPQTGDTTNLVLFSILAVGSLGALVVLVKRLMRRRKEEVK